MSSEHPSLELLKKPATPLSDLEVKGISDLDKLEVQLKQLTEQVHIAKADKIEQILTLLQKNIAQKDENLVLEREVLTKLKAKLE